MKQSLIILALVNCCFGGDIITDEILNSSSIIHAELIDGKYVYRYLKKIQENPNLDWLTASSKELYIFVYREPRIKYDSNNTMTVEFGAAHKVVKIKGVSHVLCEGSVVPEEKFLKMLNGK